jgi:ABC-type glycerol-3-phosphate transport system substrate-binding protein
MRRIRRAVSRRDFLRLGGAGLAGTALLGTVACGGGSQGGGQVVKFFTFPAETTGQEKAYLEIQVDGFQEENPKYSLERETVPTEDQRSVIQTRLQSNTPPDVFTYDTGPGFGGVLADAGLLKPLDDTYKQNGWEIYDWARQRATYNGKTYGVPDRVEEIIVYYNKSLVPEAPSTVEELMEISDELKGRDIIPFAFGDQEQWPGGHMFSIGASNVLGREGLDEILYRDGRWDTPEVITAIDVIFREFNERGYYPEGVNAITYDDANSLFFSGQAAMAPTGTWLVPTIDESVQDFEVGVFPFPSIDGSGIAPPAGVGSGLFVAENAKEPEGAIAFLDYLQQESTARQLMERLNSIPAHPVDTEGLDVSDLFKQVLSDLSEQGQAQSFGYNIDILAPANFNEVMFSGFQQVLDGSRSAEEQATALQEAWEKAKSKGDIPTQE